MKRKKILIVDDEPNIVMSLEYAFRKNNFDVFVARDGTEALQIANTKIPDAILLDIMMPQMDGYETLTRLRENKDLRQTKIVFLSAKNKATQIEKGLNLGADLYLTKPFSIKKLMTKIESLLS
ncbi:response regulator transcription factor [Flavobacteriaceae bacterium M23B6Z8]